MAEDNPNGELSILTELSEKIRQESDTIVTGDNNSNGDEVVNDTCTVGADGDKPDQSASDINVNAQKETDDVGGKEMSDDEGEKASPASDEADSGDDAMEYEGMDQATDDDEEGALPGTNLPEKERIALLETELLRARKEMKTLNKKLAKSRRSETVNQTLLVALQTKNRDLREDNLNLKDQVAPVEELVVPNFDYLTGEVQNTSRRKQRCPRPVKVVKRGRGRPRKTENASHADNINTAGGVGTRRSALKRKSTAVEKEEQEDFENEEGEEKYDEGEEMKLQGIDDDNDPEFMVMESKENGSDAEEKEEDLDEKDMEENVEEDHRKLRGKVVPTRSYKRGGRKLVNRNLPCAHCKRRFRTYTELNKHMVALNKNRIYKCKICDREFPMKCSYTRHILACSNNRTYECDLPECGATFRLLVELRTHQKAVHDIISFKPYTCEVCNKGFARKNALKEHKSIHTGEMNFQCTKCGDSFRYHSAYHIHMQKQHPKKDAYKCTLCTETFPESVLLRQHMEFHEGIRKFRCETCGKAFEKEQGLSKHIFQSHKAAEKQICYICEAEVEDFIMLKEHFRVHHPDSRNLKCQFCERTFNTLPDLDEHHRRHTGEGWVKCPVCDRQFLTKDRLQQHMRVHTNETPWLCSVCGAKFSLHSSYRYHIRYMHTEDRPHTCTTCGKSFKRAPHLKEHARIHTGVRPYTCETCGKSFVRLSHLKKHERIHQGIKPHVCAVCGHAFVEKHNLKQHERTHLKSKDDPSGAALRQRRSSSKAAPVVKVSVTEEGSTGGAVIQAEEYSQPQQQQQHQQIQIHVQQPTETKFISSQQQHQQQQQYMDQGTIQWRTPVVAAGGGGGGGGVVVGGGGGGSVMVGGGRAEIYQGVMHSNPDQMVIYSMNPVTHHQGAQEVAVIPAHNTVVNPQSTAAHTSAQTAVTVTTQQQQQQQQQHVLQTSTAAESYPTDVSFAVNIVTQ